MPSNARVSFNAGTGTWMVVVWGRKPNPGRAESWLLNWAVCVALWRYWRA